MKTLVITFFVVAAFAIISTFAMVAECFSPLLVFHPDVKFSGYFFQQ